MARKQTVGYSLYEEKYIGNESHKHNSLGKSLIIKIVDIDAILLSRLEYIAVLN